MGDAISEVLDGRLSRLLERAVDRRRHVRHGLLAVARTDGSWSWQTAHGIADQAGAQVTPTARYPIASVTKLFTATVVMRLIESGDLTLDTPMVDVLPDDVTHGLHVLKGIDHTAEIVVEHLLGHTSGLADYYETAPPGDRSPQARLLAGEDAPVPFDEVVRVVREDLTPHFAPQTLDGPKAKAHYADTNYQLLGAMIEQITGRSLAEVFASHIFTPLGLADTSSYPHKPASGRSPEPDVDIWTKDVVLVPQGALRHQIADGGIVSTLSDQVRFMQAVVSGEAFAESDTWSRMCSRWNRVFFPVGYGLGVMQYAPSRMMSPLYPIPAVVGHTGSTATWLFHCPDLKVIVAGAFDTAQPPLPFRFVPHVLRAVSAAS
ncbi:MAG: serine hydrolase domain-containing protein [Nitriliruptoraceae bacterium]